jgi:hypothetical protein
MSMWAFITSKLCFGGECWDAGAAIYTNLPAFESDFPIIGALDSWPPDWPARINGYDAKFGWKTQPAPELEQFPNKVELGPDGAQLRPSFDPTKSPSNASRSSQFGRGALNTIGDFFGSLFGGLSGLIIDLMGPVMGPGMQTIEPTMCRQNPNNPGCTRQM